MLKLDAKQLNVLKLIKFDPAEHAKMNHQMFNVIYSVYYDAYYEKEITTFKDMIETDLKNPMQSFAKILKDYGLPNKAAITAERVDVIAKDLADMAISDLTTDFLKRPFVKHISMSIFTSNVASITYLEVLLGIKLDDNAQRRLKQLNVLRQKYHEITQAYDVNVEF